MHPGDSTAAESIGENSLVQHGDPDLEGAVSSPGALAVSLQKILMVRQLVLDGNTYMLLVRSRLARHGWRGWRFGCRSRCCILSRGIPLALVPHLSVPAALCMQYCTITISARLPFREEGLTWALGRSSHTKLHPTSGDLLVLRMLRGSANTMEGSLQLSKPWKKEVLLRR